jgi:hypothetical protein
MNYVIGYVTVNRFLYAAIKMYFSFREKIIYVICTYFTLMGGYLLRGGKYMINGIPSRHYFLTIYCLNIQTEISQSGYYHRVNIWYYV